MAKRSRLDRVIESRISGDCDTAPQSSKGRLRRSTSSSHRRPRAGIRPVLHGYTHYGSKLFSEIKRNRSKQRVHCCGERADLARKRAVRDGVVMLERRISRTAGDTRHNPGISLRLERAAQTGATARLGALGLMSGCGRARGKPRELQQRDEEIGVVPEVKRLGVVSMEALQSLEAVDPARVCGVVCRARADGLEHLQREGAVHRARHSGAPAMAHLGDEGPLRLEECGARIAAKIASSTPSGVAVNKVVRGRDCSISGGQRSS